MKDSKKTRFLAWLDGEKDLYTGNVEASPQKEQKLPPKAVAEHMREHRRIAERVNDVEHNPEYRIFQQLYRILAVIFGLLLSALLIVAVSWLPPVGNAVKPDNNEVPARYIEKGLQETGAVNIVTGMILDYRAFDTLGEVHVLFAATVTVLVLLHKDKGKKEDNDRIYEPKNDAILQKAAFVLVPMILTFGVYIILNGHLSPGGGFSGGAIIGAGLILYLNAFGFARTERFFTEKTYRRVCFFSLAFYCLAKSYSFYIGANDLHSGVSLGTPGAILSSGLILPLNICVGLVVACTMYAFYALFRKGGF